MSPAPQEDFIPRILAGYTAKNRAAYLGRDSVHLRIDYARLRRDDGCGLLSRRDTRRLTEALCQLLAKAEKIDSPIQKGRMYGELRLHLVLYHYFRLMGCGQIDLNVFQDGQVRDKRFLVNFLSATVFQVL